MITILLCILLKDQGVNLILPLPEAAHDEDEVHLFQTQTRFLPSPETEAIVDAKMR